MENTTYDELIQEMEAQVNAEHFEDFGKEKKRLIRQRLDLLRRLKATDAALADLMTAENEQQAEAEDEAKAEMDADLSQDDE